MRHLIRQGGEGAEEADGVSGVGCGEDRNQGQGFGGQGRENGRVLTSTVKTAEKTKTTIPECPSGNLTDIKAMTKEIDGLATAYSRTVSEVKGKAEAVNGSKLDKIVADATKILNDSKGRVKDDKTRTVLENAIKTKDEKAISDAVKAVNDSIKAKSDADANARAEKEKQAAENTAQRRTTAPTRAEQPEDTPDTPVVATRNPRAAATRTLHSSPQVVRPAAVIRDATAAATAAFPGRWQRRRFHGRGRRI